MTLTFSIVTVCWNDLDGLRKTHESLLAQSEGEFEWIVVDGGSQDGTADWLRACPTVDRWVSEPDPGIYDAMNKGLDMATGEYVLFLNSGDSLADERVLADVSDAARAKATPLVYGDAIDVAAGGSRHYRKARSVWWRWLGMFTQHQAMLFRRSSIGEFRYDTSFRLSGDYAFVSRFIEANPGDLRLDRPICRYVLGGRSTQDRATGIREDRIVRREILGLPWALVWVVEAMQRVHQFVRSAMPSGFLRLRYRGGTGP